MTETSAGHGPVFEIVEGSVAFGGNQALDSVSFSMAKGQLVGLIGPNGSGKTTLLNATSGIYPLDSGAIRFEGRPIEKAPPHRIARAGIFGLIAARLKARGLISRAPPLTVE